MPDGEEDSGTGPAPLTLSDAERTILETLRLAGSERVEEVEVARRAGVSGDAARGALQRLRAKRLAVVDEEIRIRPRLTRRGDDAVARGVPERRLLEAIREHAGSLDPGAVAGLGFGEEERAAAIGYLRRHRWLEPGVPFRLTERARSDRPSFPEEEAIRAVSAGTKVDSQMQRELVRRGLVGIERDSEKRWSLSEEGRRLPVERPDRPYLGLLTTALLSSGAWQDREFRPYDVRASVPWVTGARPHPYVAWLREFREILVGLGFEEVEGPLVETEFWNADVLFMPQAHPARSIHDMLSLEGVTGRLPDATLLERVAAVHEGRPVDGDPAPLSPGWRAPYDRALSGRVVLRSQTTAVSARYLAAHPSPPFRVFSLDKNFRRDAIDATHHIEFDQCEGILGASGTTLRQLIGVFRALAEAIGIRELRLRPTYFPFTEPSVEGHVRHPRVGWMEVFPGGMFRPEVLRPLGVGVPVAAWGIGVARLAMVALGYNDLREMYDDDLARLTGAPG